MTILRAFKYRIYPTPIQEVLLNKTFGCARVVWNHNVEMFNKVTDEKPLTSTELRDKFEWMGEVSAAAVQQKEIDFKTFKKNYFSKQVRSPKL
jgi:putative transposase